MRVAASEDKPHLLEDKLDACVRGAPGRAVRYREKPLGGHRRRSSGAEFTSADMALG
jgi:hypothetical protein